MEARDFYFLRFVFRPLSLRFACFFVLLSLRIALRAFFAFCGDCVRCVFLTSFVVAGRLRKEKGEPRGENDHGAFPLVLSGQRRATGCTHDPRFLSRQSELQERSFNKYKRAFRAEGRTSIKL